MSPRERRDHFPNRLTHSVSPPPPQSKPKDIEDAGVIHWFMPSCDSPSCPRCHAIARGACQLRKNPPRSPSSSSSRTTSRRTSDFARCCYEQAAISWERTRSKFSSPSSIGAERLARSDPTIPLNRSPATITSGPIIEHAHESPRDCINSTELNSDAVTRRPQAK